MDCSAKGDPMTQSADLFASHHGAVPFTREALDEMHAIHAKQIADDVAERTLGRFMAKPTTQRRIRDGAFRALNGIPDPPKWCIRYRLRGYPQETAPEPAEGAMHDRSVLLGMGATNIEVVEVKR